MSSTIDTIITQVDAVTAPPMMSKKEAIKFLEELITQIDSRIDKLTEEIIEEDNKEDEDGS